MTTTDCEFHQKIERAHRGGPDSVAALLDVYRPWLLRLAENAIGSRLRARLAASDVVQGSILLAINAFPEFRGTTQAELETWLKTIFTHHLIDSTRAAKAQKRGIYQSFPLGEAHACDTQTPSKIVAADEDAARLVQAIGRLEEQPRTIVQLRYLQGLSFEGIGQELDLPRHTVRRLWVQAIEALAKQLR